MPLPFVAVGLFFKPLVSLIKVIPPKVWVFLGVVLVILGTLWYVDRLQKKIENLVSVNTLQKVEIVKLTDERAKLMSSINAQNLAIDGWKLAGDNLVLKLAEATKTNTKNRLKYEKELAKLKGEKVPLDCNEALAWHSNHLRVVELKWSSSLSK